MVKHRQTGKWAALVAVSVTIGCGQTQMVATSGRIRDQMIMRNYKGALSVLEQSKKEAFKEQDRVVYWMDQAMLLHLIGNYKLSSEILNKAEQRSAELYTKSISKGITAAFTSDAATDYAGEDHEKVLMNVVKVFNFLAIGDQSAALIEARKINEKLALFNTKYARKNVYNQDAFAHWLMGILFELEKSYDDARIAYVKALEVYQQDFAGNYGMPVPGYLTEDVVRASILSGARDEASKYGSQNNSPVKETAELMKTHGEVILFHLNGEGPSKSDFIVNCWFHSALSWYCDAEPGGEFMKKTTITVASGGTVIKVAFPQIHTKDPMNAYATLSVGGNGVQSELAYPLNEIASKTLADKAHRIYKDAIIRVITKTLTSKASGAVAEKAGGKLLGWIAEQGTSATMQAFEEADKRAWTTLPAQIEVARVWATPGTHDVTVTLANGRRQTIPNVTVVAGKRVFITYRTIP